MSIGLVIANISGALRQSAAVSANGGLQDGAASAPAGAASGNAAASEPASGQARLTPGFSVLVLELLNDKGAVTATIPTAQQLAAYRNGTATPPS